MTNYQMKQIIPYFLTALHEGSWVALSDMSLATDCSAVPRLSIETDYLPALTTNNNF